MTWTIELLDTPAEEVYALLKRHRLVPDSRFAAAAACKVLASGDHHRIFDGESVVADLFVSGVLDDDTAAVDLVPVPRYFRTGFDVPFAEATAPVFDALFVERGIRRITAIVPASRSRTKRALKSIGFKPEGNMTDGLNLYKTGVEDLKILGLLEPWYRKAMEGLEQWASSVE